jgi:hypothetical protein
MTFVACILVAIYMLGSGSLLNSMGTARGIPNPSFLARQLLLVVSIVMLVSSHEAGHWIAGRAVGWRGLRFRIGPLALVRSSTGWRIRWIKWDLGGGVTFTPLTFAEFRTSDAIFTAGGPLASLLFAAAFAGIAWYAQNGIAFWLFGTMAQWSWLGALSLIPAGKGLVRSDGYWLWQLMRGGADLERRQRYMLANMSHGTALRPRDWPARLMEPLLKGPLPSEDRHDGYLAYVHLMDSDDPQAALPWLVGVLSGWRKTDPAEYSLEAAYHAGVHAQDAALAAKWLGCVGVDTDVWVRLRAEAAVAWAEGRSEDARRLSAQALSKLEDTPPSGHRAYETARLNDLLRNCAVGQAPTPNALARIG